MWRGSGRGYLKGGVEREELSITGMVSVREDEGACRSSSSSRDVKIWFYFS